MHETSFFQAQIQNNIRVQIINSAFDQYTLFYSYCRYSFKISLTKFI